MYNNLPPIPVSKGINAGMSEDQLQPGEVADAVNFFFSKGEAKTRPGRLNITVTGSPNVNSIYAKTLWRESGLPLTAVMATGKLYSLNDASNLDEITGAGITYGDPHLHNADMVNGVVLVGNHPAGILRWDPTTTAYTIMTDARYRYVAAHLSRAVAAYGLSGTAGAPRTVAYSNSGDETDWVAGPTSSAGASLLVDAPDDITGIFVIKNIVVIARRTGFHLGYPTGISIPPFRFEAWNRRGIGVYFPSTLDYTDNMALFVGEDDVYINDLSKVTPIGAKIRDQLMPALKAGVKYLGFISRNYTGQSRLQYHLFPQNPGNDLIQFHYVYDLYEDNWAKLSYNDAKDLRAAFYRISAVDSTVAILDRNGNLRHWDDRVTLDTDAYLVTPTVQIAELSADGRVDSVILKYRDQGPTAEVRVTCGVLGQDSVYRESEKKRSLGTESASRRWMRALFHMEISGQMLTMRVDVPAGVRLSIDSLTPRVQGSGEFKGVAL